MATLSDLKTILDDVIQTGHEIEFHLHKEKVCGNGADFGIPNGQSEQEFLPILESSRKKLANAAVQLLQLTTDPKEYLEQLSANVSVFLVQLITRWPLIL